MAGKDNADVECSSENNVEEGEDSSRTVNCLRGRLLAERMASRNATEEADKLGIRLLEVEMLLEQEAKSRKRAEKKLKFFMKRLKCINISYCGSHQEQTKDEKKIVESRKGSLNLEEIDDSQLMSTSISSSQLKTDQEYSDEMGSNENYSKSPSSSADQLNSYEDSKLKCDDEDVDDLMALVPVKIMWSEKESRVDPDILDESVKRVLESLKRAKEQIQTSMERRSMIKVG